MSEEVTQTLENVQRTLDELLVRGLRAVSAGEIARLRAMAQEFRQIGAAHLSERLERLVVAIESDDRAAAEALLAAQTSLRLFERVLSREVAAATLAALSDDGEGATA